MIQKISPSIYRAPLKIQISSQLLCCGKNILLTYQPYAVLQNFSPRFAFGRTLNFLEAPYKERGYRFFFFSREESRIHVHVYSGDSEAKFWLEPEIELVKNYQLSRTQLRQIEVIIEEQYDEFKSSWKRHFSD